MKPLILVVAVILVLSGVGLLYREDGIVQEGHCSPYSVSQIKKMMKYHGTLGAVFDGRLWWFRSNGRWARLDTERAKKQD